MPSIFDLARSYAAAGISIIPILTDGSKAPALPTGHEVLLRQRPATDAELLIWFGSGKRGIGMLCGPISGDRCAIDLDRADLFEPYAELLEVESPGLLALLTVHKTPRGWHLCYRCPGHIGKNKKLAAELDPVASAAAGVPRPHTLIETRGEGGYILLPGCPPSCHPDGGIYTYHSGPSLENASIITPDHQQTLFDCARLFHTWVEPARQAFPVGPTCPLSPDGRGDSVGDDFNARADWRDILEPAGWKLARQSGGRQGWTRPGKDRGISATTGLRDHSGKDMLHPFSSNAHPLEPDRDYDKFGVYTRLCHGGDFQAAAKALAAAGWGKQTSGVNLIIGGAPAQSALDVVPDDGKGILQWADKVERRRVAWLWEGRIPLGKLTTFAGVGGLGKTFVLLDIAARLSRGLLWPCGTFAAPQGKTLFLSGEDDPEDTLAPRLFEMGADLTQIAFLRMQYLDKFTLDDLKILDRALAESGGGVNFVVMDPPSSFLGSVDEHKNAEVRRLLSPLKSWAQTHRLALVMNSHLNKQTNKTEATARVMGSVAWVNAVRAANLFSRDPDAQDRVFFMPMKMNVGRAATGLVYRIVPHGECARVEWLGEVKISANDAINQEKGKCVGIVAAEWLIERFREKKKWIASEIFSAGADVGLSKKSLYEARRRLHLPECLQEENGAGVRCHVWWVPDNWEPLRDGVS